MIMNKKEKIQKIALVYAGGTIGMQPKNGELAPPKNEMDFQNACQVVVDEFQREYKIKVEFQYFDKKDSTERTPGDWMKIHSIIKDSKKHIAFVVVHGTDTLANTASAISFSFGHPDLPGQSSLSTPVVFTASQQPIYKNGGDGKFNLYHALETALQMYKNEINRVVISFWDKILLGTRATKTHDRKYDAFDSPAIQPIGLITSGGIEISNFIYSLKRSDKTSSNFSDGVSTIEISPSTAKGIITTLSEAKNTRVLVLKTLGEGNVPSRLIKEICEQIEKGKIIVLSSPFAGGSVGGSVYELGAEAIRVGAIPAGDMVPPTVDAKCSWLIGNGITDSKQFAKKLQQNHTGEISLNDTP